MRVRHGVWVNITEDTAGRNKLFAPDPGTAEVIMDGFAESVSGTAKLLSAGGAFSIQFPSIADARGFYLRADKDFTLAINGGAPITVRRGVVGPTGSTRSTSARVFMECGVSSLVVTPQENLTLQWCVWGDPVS